MDALAENPAARDVVVVAAHTERGTGRLTELPITAATLRGADGALANVRIVGGHLPGAREAHLAGYVVPAPGMSVRSDLREPREGGANLSHAFVQDPSHATWTTLPVAFALAAPGSKTLGLSPVGDLAVATAAWARPSCSAFRATVAASAVTASPGDDGLNVIFFEDASWPVELVPQALGQTVIHQNADGSMHDADIFLNGVDSAFSLQGEAGTVDVRSVLTHEIGHALGLAHSPDPAATMYPTLAGRAWRSLEADDRAGVCALYPGKGSGGCDEAPCPAGFYCVAAACERPREPAAVCSPCARVPDACAGAGADARCIDLPGEVGRVCGRACDPQRPCGRGFSCSSTSSSGDDQCVADDLCRSATNTCTTTADCASAHVTATCVRGACAGMGDASSRDGGVGDDGGASDDGGPPLVVGGGGGGGCASAGSPSIPPWLVVMVAGGVAVRRKRRHSLGR